MQGGLVVKRLGWAQGITVEIAALSVVTIGLFIRMNLTLET